DSLSPKVGDVHSIEMLYLVPRVIMGLLAVLDTFLIYKIAEHRYSRNVAFVASILFAVMPLSWMLRRVLLESIQLPFILSSILFLFYKRNLTVGDNNSIKDKNSNYHNNNLIIFTTILSGIFLGLAIFTKLPAFLMIPLVAYLVYTHSNNNNNHKNIKTLGLWFIPVILIPMIWPAYAISTGNFDEWLNGVLWQADRSTRSLSNAVEHLFKMDPLLLALAIAGIIYARLKKDYFLPLWIFPYLILLFLIDWVYFFHFIPILPAFCIAAAVLLVDLARKSNKIKIKILKPLTFSAITAIIIFGFLNTTTLITTNLNTTYFELVSFINENLPNNPNPNSKNGYEQNVVLVGPNGAWTFFWILKYIFDKDVDFKWFELPKDYIGSITNEKFLLMADREVRYGVYMGNSDDSHINEIKKLYNHSNQLKVFPNTTITYDLDKYPYNNILDDFYKLRDIIKTRGIDWSREIEVRGNYSIQ
ncbi:MAG TPA: phospholipid carrier-dependent glycosyltransferase, partial [Nitrososphaeraceae archaeon]|nr:phospholipid carrier-dependent glycosyltransferase [Nitrososphaeraceae archaeon]